MGHSSFSLITITQKRQGCAVKRPRLNNVTELQSRKGKLNDFSVLWLCHSLEWPHRLSPCFHSLFLRSKLPRNKIRIFLFLGTFNKPYLRHYKKLKKKLPFQRKRKTIITSSLLNGILRVQSQVGACGFLSVYTLSKRTVLDPCLASAPLSIPMKGSPKTDLCIIFWGL